MTTKQRFNYICKFLIWFAIAIDVFNERWDIATFFMATLVYIKVNDD